MQDLAGTARNANGQGKLNGCAVQPRLEGLDTIVTHPPGWEFKALIPVEPLI
jgi:hypothetical protein